MLCEGGYAVIMTLFALGLVLVSAFLHASWNLLAKRSAGGLPFVWLLDLASVLIYLPVVLGFIYWQRPSLGLLQILAILGSAVIHLGYFLSLQRGYRVGDLSLVYPLARGTGPLLATIAAILFLGERPTPLALGGTALIVVSVFILAGGVRLLSADASTQTRQALRFGLLTGTLIASYTLFDKYAVSVLLIQPLLFLWLGNVARALLLTPMALRDWSGVRQEWQTNRLEVLGVAVLSPLAYILVLTALVFTPVSYIAPTREISILIAALFGARLLNEGDARRRLSAAALMVLGVIALALG